MKKINKQNKRLTFIFRKFILISFDSRVLFILFACIEICFKRKFFNYNSIGR
jgi:hypothetical protein